MYSSKLLLTVYLLITLIQISSSRPQIKTKGEIESNKKNWENGNTDISLLKKLEKSGIGVKRSLTDDKNKQEEEKQTKIEIIESVKNDDGKKDAKSLENGGDDDDDQSTTRVKKQSPNNVCIKVSFFIKNGLSLSLTFNYVSY